MPDKVLWQSQDDLGETNLSEVAAKANSTDYVERGLDVTADFSADTIDITSGHAAVAESGAAYDLFPASRTDLALPDSAGNNYIYLTHDPSVDDDISYVIESTESPPSTPSLLIEVVDTSANETTPQNRDPDAEFDQVQTEDHITTLQTTYPDGTKVTSHPVAGGRNLQPEGEQTGLVADATGIQYEGKLTQTIDDALLTGSASVRLEAVTASSAGDEEVAVEVYDETAAAVVDSVVITGGGQAGKEISASLTGGNDVHVRWNVTTASGTAGATFDAVAALLVGV